MEREAGESGEDVDDMDTAYLLYNEAVLHFLVSVRVCK